MISKVLLSRYKIIPAVPRTGQIRTETLHGTKDITQYLLERDFSKEHRLEVDGAYNFYASNLDLEIYYNLEILEFVKKEYLESGSYFYTIEVFDPSGVDYWGYLDPNSVEIDYENYTITLTAVDMMVWYKSVWDITGNPEYKKDTWGEITYTATAINTLAGQMESSYIYFYKIIAYKFGEVVAESQTFGVEMTAEYNAVQIEWNEVNGATGYRIYKTVERNSQSLNCYDGEVGNTTDYIDLDYSHTNLGNVPSPPTFDIEAYFNLLIPGTLIESVNVKLEGTLFEMDLQMYNNKMVKDNVHFNIMQFIQEIQKHYACYVYITPDRVLNVISRNYYDGLKALTIDSAIINPVKQITELAEYTAILISNARMLDDPDKPDRPSEERYARNLGNRGDADDIVYYAPFIIRSDGSGGVVVEFGSGVLFGEPRNAEKYGDKILDLTQNFNEWLQSWVENLEPERPLSWSFAMFSHDNFLQRYKRYRDILQHTEWIKCSLYDTYPKILRRVVYKGKSYTVRSYKKNYLSKTCEIEAIEVIDG